MYSAVKVGTVCPFKAGAPGENGGAQSAPGDHYRLELCGGAGEQEFWLDVECAGGTCVRTLVEELGRASGLPAASFGAAAHSGGRRWAGSQRTACRAIQAAKDEGDLERLLLACGHGGFGHLPGGGGRGDAARLLKWGAHLSLPASRKGYPAYGREGFLGLGLVREDTLTVENWS